MICKADSARTFMWCVVLGALFPPVTHAQAGAQEGEAIIYLQGADNVVHCGGISVGDCQIATDISAAQELISGYRSTAKLRTGQPLKTLRVIFPAGVYRLRSAIEIDGWGKVPDGPSIVLQGAGRESSRLAGTVQVPRSQWRSAIRRFLWLRVSPGHPQERARSAAGVYAPEIREGRHAAASGHSSLEH